jgi:hypothetical protein
LAPQTAVRRLEVRRNRIEDAAQVGADQLKRRDGRNRDQRSDQPILDGSRTVLIPKQAEKNAHRTFLSYQKWPQRLLRKEGKGIPKMVRSHEVALV